MYSTDDLAGSAVKRQRGFTLIELLTVIGIISLLISILMPSLSRARDQAKGVHCLARMKDFAIGLAAYENIYDDLLPPALWEPTFAGQQEPSGYQYGWNELLFGYIYQEKVELGIDFPGLRNFDPEKWDGYFICKASVVRGISAGHYRVYLPAWAAGSYHVQEDGTFGDDTAPDPTGATTRTFISPKLVLLGDANERSERGDGLGTDDCSYIGANEANTAGSDGNNGNRFSDRHYGGTNYLFADLHAKWNTKLRDQLALDWDLNGVQDVPVGR